MRAVFIAAFFALGVYLNAQVKAITQNGDVVILKSNGTWVYEEDASDAIAPSMEEQIAPTNKSNESGYDIRTSNWGDSFSMVRATEKIPENEWLEDKYGGFDVKGFETEVAGLSAAFLYYFLDDMLVCARYAVMEYHANNDDYLDDYDRLHEILSEKYGHERIKEEWHDESWKNSPSFKGFALKQGDITMTSKWETKQTKVSHSISSRDYEILHYIDYDSKEYVSLIDEGVNKAGIHVL